MADRTDSPVWNLPIAITVFRIFLVPILVVVLLTKEPFGQDQDLLYGGQGDDVLYGNKGDDILVGNKGNDVLVGGAGANTLVGGEGADYFYVDEDDIVVDLSDEDFLIYL